MLFLELDMKEVAFIFIYGRLISLTMYEDFIKSLESFVVCIT